MTKTKSFAIGVMILCTLFTSFGSLFMKIGSDKLSLSIHGLFNGYPLFIGLFFYFLGFLLMTFAFRHGELSLLFPFVSLSFVWVTALSFFFLDENIFFSEILGIALIIAGVVVISISQTRNSLSIRG